MRAVVWPLALVLLAGCGVEPQEEPERVPRDRLPSVAALPSPGQVVQRSRVWSARAGRLVPVTVDLGSTGPVARVRALLALSEPAQQPPTALPPGTRLLAVRQRGDVLEVRLSEEVTGLAPSALPLALGQVVLTLTEDPATQQVRVLAGARPLALPDSRGGSVLRPLRRDDFAGLVDAPAAPAPSGTRGS